MIGNFSDLAIELHNAPKGADAFIVWALAGPVVGLAAAMAEAQRLAKPGLDCVVWRVE